MTLVILSHSAFLMQAIEAGLAEKMPWLRVIGQCYTVEAGMEAVSHLKPDIVLLDLGMPKANKGHFLKLLESGSFRTVVLTANEKVRRRFEKGGSLIVHPMPVDMELLACVLDSLKP